MDETEEEAGLRIQAEKCPLIRAAFSTGDIEVIRRMEKVHPPSCCEYVKRAEAA